MTARNRDDVRVANSNERGAWTSGIVAVGAFLFYLYSVAPQLQDTAPDDVSWVPAMLWAIGISIVGSIVGAIVSSIAGAVGATIKGLDAEDELATDNRDKEIQWRARLTGYWFYGALAAAVMILAMLDASTFWIGSAAFMIGSLATVAESGTQIVLYRKGM